MPPASQPVTGLRFSFTRARRATSALFLVNGAVVGAWVPFIPARAHALGLNAAALGGVLLASGAGAVLAMPFAALFNTRFGSRAVCTAAGILFPFAMACCALAPHVALLVPALLLLGLSGATQDISMNAQAILVEQRLDRRILSACHGLFSLGGVLGSVLISAGFALHLPHASLAIATAAILIVIVLVAEPSLVPRLLESGATPSRMVWPSGRLLLLGTLVFLAMTTEGAIADWSGVFLRDARHYGPGTAGLGYACSCAAMLLGRLTGDRLLARIGEVPALRLGGALGAAGIALLLLSPTLPLQLTGFALLGLGVANSSPVLYRAAGRVPGIPAGIGLATAVGIGYTGLLAGPPLLGLVGHGLGLAAIFAVLALLLCTLALSASVARR